MFTRKSQFHLERLEDRMMMAGDAFAFFNGATLTTTTTKAPVAEAVSYLLPASESMGQRATEVFDPSQLTEAELDQRMGLPMLDSLPGAPRTLFLDFTGNFERDWWQNYNGQVDHYYNHSTPAYDTDSDLNLFDLNEQQEIRNIWAAVAEDFAPFNINVSTHFYGSLEDGKALKVAIGGNDNWLKREVDENIAGTSEIRSYLSSAPNTVFVFEDNFGNNTLGTHMQIAATASHEAGHAFSLLHRSVWSADGKTITKPYDSGTDVWTPIMGQSRSIDRTTWSRGVTEQGPYTFQDDFATLGGLLGFRGDEPSLTALTSSTTTAFNAPLVGSGLINTMTDIDVFQFTTGGGQLQITAMAAPIGANLIPRAEIWSASTLVKAGTFDGPTVSLLAPKTSVIDATLSAGTYFIRVKGGGDYGDMGQYSVSVVTTPLKGAGVGGTTKPPVVGQVGPLAPTKTTSTTTKSTSIISTETSKMSASDGKSNETVYATMPTNSTLLLDGTTAKTKQTSPSLALKTSLKDFAFESLYTNSLRR